MICISINHKNSITETRERFALSDEEKEQFFRMAGAQRIDGCVLLMTCNRCEIYISGSREVYHAVEEFFQKKKGITREEFWKCAMRYEKKAAVKHLYQVVCGLESAVLGEVEIIRQVKLAYESAKTRQMTDGDLNVIFQSALQLAKEIADQSMMTRLPVSVGTLTTLDALQFCAGKEEPHILLVGASGDIGSIVLRDLVDADDRVRIVATSRKHKQYELAFQDTEQEDGLDVADARQVEQSREESRQRKTDDERGTLSVAVGQEVAQQDDAEELSDGSDGVEQGEAYGIGLTGIRVET